MHRQFWLPQKAGKDRNPRYTLLKRALSFCSFLNLLIPVATWITCNDRAPGRAVIFGYPSPDFRSRFPAVLDMQVAFIAVGRLQAWNFLIV